MSLAGESMVPDSPPCLSVHVEGNLTLVKAAALYLRQLPPALGCLTVGVYSPITTVGDGNFARWY